jgi:ectoine hydroxylase-related dioxygenase (phytanoyl-CoA dioxygenase family)
MLDDCTLDNGPLLVVPGTHTGPVWDHHANGYFCGAVDPDSVEKEVARAVPLLGPAGSMSFHHVRLLHGSAQNRSDQPRALLLYEYAAADAWPLMGVRDLADFDARLVTAPPSVEPRLVPAPVRMPLPPAIHQGSIYENQLEARRYFSMAAAAEEAPART